MAFKLAVVEQVDKGELTYKQAQAKYGIQGRTTVLTWMRRHGRQAWSRAASSAAMGHCNPGTDPNTGQPFTMADNRTQLFPSGGVDKFDPFYEHASLREFKHPQTGALLTKMQHPDVEIYWGSKHDKAGVDCAHCHMPKFKDKKTGKTYTSHWASSPREYVKESCLTCPTDKSEAQMKRVMDGMSSHCNGKLSEAEYPIGLLFDAFKDAQEAGVSETVLIEARKQHSIAYSNWEWWTAANSAALHKLDQAKGTLARSVGAAQAGVEILRDGIAAQKKAVAVAAPVAAAAADKK